MQTERVGALRVYAGRSALIAPVFACAVVCGGTQASVHSATTQPTAASPVAAPGSAGQKGAYRVAQIKVDGGATISYPTDAEPPFAAILYCPGYLRPQASDAAWAPLMASHGIVFMTIATQAASDSVAQLQKAELDALESLEREHTRAGGPLQGKLDLSRVSLLGWSLGGGGAWSDATMPP